MARLVAVVQRDDDHVLEIGDLLDGADPQVAAGHHHDSGTTLSGRSRLARLEQSAFHAKALGVGQGEGGADEMIVGAIRAGLGLDVAGEGFGLRFHDGIPLHLVRDSFNQTSARGTADPQ